MHSCPNPPVLLAQLETEAAAKGLPEGQAGAVSCRGELLVALTTPGQPLPGRAHRAKGSSRAWVRSWAPSLHPCSCKSPSHLSEIHISASNAQNLGAQSRQSLLGVIPTRGPGNEEFGFFLPLQQIHHFSAG